jgi:CMP-N-acetylneuraminic acid synthetase
MICALMMGRAGSIGFPNKNIKKVLGRRLFEYPLLASRNSQNVDKIFVTTNCPVITRVSKKYGAIHIDRPTKLANSKSLSEQVVQYGYNENKKILNLNAKNIEFIVLLMANAPTITGKLIDKGINILRKNKNFDSAVTTSIYNMWSPLRARKVNNSNLLKPFVPFETFGNPKKLNCDRDSQGDVYYADMSVSIVRPKCLENIKEGLLPQKWMGKKIAPIPSWGGCDVDYEWQLPMVEFWLKKNGYKDPRF